MFAIPSYDFRVMMSSPSVGQVQQVGVESNPFGRQPFITTYSGNILLTTREKLDVIAVKVRMQGVILDTTQNRPGSFGRRREIYTIDQNIWEAQKDPSTGDITPLEAGDHAWPIHFVLPDERVPPSYDGTSGKVQHFVTAFLFLKNARSPLTAITEFRHVDPVDLLDCHLPDPSFEELTIRFPNEKWGKKREQMDVKLSLPQTGYLPGELIRVPIVVLASGRTASRVPAMVAHVELIQHVLFHQKPQRRNSVSHKIPGEKRVVLAQSFPMPAVSLTSGQSYGSVYPGAEHRELLIKIPTSTMPSVLNHPEWFKLEYRLRIHLDVAVHDAPTSGENNGKVNEVATTTLSNGATARQDPKRLSPIRESMDGIQSVTPITEIINDLPVVNASIRKTVRFPIVIGTRRGVMVNGRMSSSHRSDRGPLSPRSVESLGSNHHLGKSASDSGSIKEKFRKSKFGSLLLDRSWSLRSRSSTMSSRQSQMSESSPQD